MVTFDLLREKAMVGRCRAANSEQRFPVARARRKSVLRNWLVIEKWGGGEGGGGEEQENLLQGPLRHDLGYWWVGKGLMLGQQGEHSVVCVNLEPVS